MSFSIGETKNQSESNEVLRAVIVPIVNQEYCNRLHKGAITDQMICAGYDEGGKDSCQNDSGGPMFARIGNIGVRAIGVVSWRKGCAESKSPGIYARISAVRSWIKNVTGI